MQSIHTSVTPTRSKLPNLKMHSVPRYTDVHFIFGKSTSGSKEKIFYIRYRKDGKEIKEKAGRQYKDSMTARRASLLRAMRINGSELTNTQRRSKNKELKAKQVWTFDLLWTHLPASERKRRKRKTRYSKKFRIWRNSMEVISAVPK